MYVYVCIYIPLYDVTLYNIILLSVSQYDYYTYYDYYYTTPYTYYTLFTGMLAHCGYENDMKLTASEGISKQLLCAMRVHLMNETEVYIFCPANVLVWEENCHNVAFANYTAISPTNEQAVIHALRGTLYSIRL